MAFDPDYALFLMVAEEGSLSAAARRLRLSPAMVSKRLQRLEGRLGVTLVHRTTRRLVLTEAGARLRDDLSAIQISLDAAEARVTGARDMPAGVLRISAPTSFGRLHVAPHLGAFLDMHPAVELRFDLSDRYVDLLSDRIDCAIRIASAVPPGLVAHRLAGSGRILCAAPAYIAAHGEPRAIEALSGHRLLAADGQMPWRLVSRGRTAEVTRDSHVATNSREVVRDLAQAGAGIALRSLWDVGDALRDGRLIRILPAWQGSADVGVYAVHLPSSQPSAAVAAFVAFLRDALAGAPWEADA